MHYAYTAYMDTHKLCYHQEGHKYRSAIWQHDKSFLGSRLKPDDLTAAYLRLVPWSECWNVDRPCLDSVSISGGGRGRILRPPPALLLADGVLLLLLFDCAGVAGRCCCCCWWSAPTGGFAQGLTPIIRHVAWSGPMLTRRPSCARAYSASSLFENIKFIEFFKPERWSNISPNFSNNVNTSEPMVAASKPYTVTQRDCSLRLFGVYFSELTPPPSPKLMVDLPDLNERVEWGVLPVRTRGDPVGPIRREGVEMGEAPPGVWAPPFLRSVCRYRSSFCCWTFCCWT